MSEAATTQKEARRIESAIASGMVCVADKQTTQEVLLITEGWVFHWGTIRDVIVTPLGVDMFRLQTKPRDWSKHE